MKANVGSADKIFRIILGLVILALGLAFKSWWGLIGLIPILTVIMSWCPLYAIFGMTTHKPKTPPTAAP